MKDVIIPVDFSENSLHAARFAADMLKNRNDIRVILYHMYKHDNDAASTQQYLSSLSVELEQKGVQNIELVNESGDDLIDSLGRLAYQKTAELIIMGITEREDWKLLFRGNNSLKMAAKNVCPVMIVPAQAQYSGMRNIALASDFTAVKENTPELAIKTVLNLFQAKLHIINVDSRHYVSLSPEFIEQRAELNNITIPRNHSFLDNLFGGSHTQKLAQSTKVPLLAAHQ